jgi:hypothetical protein
MFNRNWAILYSPRGTTLRPLTPGMPRDQEIRRCLLSEMDDASSRKILRTATRSVHLFGDARMFPCRLLENALALSESRSLRCNFTVTSGLVRDDLVTSIVSTQFGSLVAFRRAGVSAIKLLPDRTTSASRSRKTQQASDFDPSQSRSIARLARVQLLRPGGSPLEMRRTQPVAPETQRLVEAALPLGGAPVVEPGGFSAGLVRAADERHVLQATALEIAPIVGATGDAGRGWVPRQQDLTNRSIQR